MHSGSRTIDLMGRAILVGTVAIILLVTLIPVQEPTTDWTFWRFLSGDAGVADGIANVLLFAPLGMALGLRGSGVARAWLVGTALSLGIELAQFAIPGRWPTIGDLVFNGLGAALGCYLTRVRSHILRPSRIRATWLSVAAGATSASIFFAPAYLLTPPFARPTSSDLHTTYSARFQKRVLEARIGTVRLPPVRSVTLDTGWPMFLEGVPLEILARAGEPPRGLLAFVRVVDDAGRDVLVIGSDRRDLAFESHSRAKALKLSKTSFRLRNWFQGTAPEDTVRLAAKWTGSAFCVALNQRVHCDLGFTVGHGWWLIHRLGGPVGFLNSVVSVCWVVGLMVPFGFWARPRVGSVIGGLLPLGVFALAPWLTGVLLPTPWWQWLALVAGVTTGVTVGVVFRRTTGRTRPHRATRRRLV